IRIPAAACGSCLHLSGATHGVRVRLAWASGRTCEMRAEYSYGVHAGLDLVFLTHEPLMHVQQPHYIANFDSAIAMVRALANSLARKDFPLLGTQPTWTAPGMKLLASAVNRMPP